MLLVTLTGGVGSAHAGGFSAPVSLSGYDPGANGPLLASAGDQAAMAVWDQYPPTPWDGPVHPQVRAERVTPAGADAATTLDTDAYDSVIATDQSGRASVAWVRGDGYQETQIRLADYDPATGFGPTQVMAAENGPVAVARNERGDTLVAYEGQEGTYGRIWARFRPAGATAFEPAVKLSDVPSILYAQPSVSLAEDGTGAVAWMDWPAEDSDRQRALVSVRAAGDESWTPAHVLSSTGEIGEWPAVAAGPGGGAMVAWREHDGRPQDSSMAPGTEYAATRGPNGDFGDAVRLGRFSSNQTPTPRAATTDVGGLVTVPDEPEGQWYTETLDTWRADFLTGLLTPYDVGDPATKDQTAFAVNRRGDSALAASIYCSPCGGFGVSRRGAIELAFGAQEPIRCPLPFPGDVLGLDVGPDRQSVVLWRDYHPLENGTEGPNDPVVSFQSDAIPSTTCDSADPPLAAPPDDGATGATGATGAAGAADPVGPPPPVSTAPRPAPAPGGPAGSLAAPGAPSIIGATLTSATDLALTVASVPGSQLVAQTSIAPSTGPRVAAQAQRRARTRRAVIHLRLRRADGRRLRALLHRHAVVHADVSVTATSGTQSTRAARTVRVHAR